MATYSGPLNVLTDSSGSVIPVSINPADVPAGGLIIDVSNVQNPPSGTFGYIAGITVDASAANNAVGLISLSFDGGYNLVRNVNSGTQVFRVSGPILRVTIQKLAWTTGQINIVLWNSAPSNEVMASLSINATGSVTISGTPTVQIAPGQTVSITAGNVNIGTVTGVVTIEPGAHNLSQGFVTPIVLGSNQYTLVGATTNGTIRTIFLTCGSIQTFHNVPGYIIFKIQNVAQTQTYWYGIVNVSNISQQYIEITSLTLLAIPFVGGLILDIETHTFVSIDSQSLVNVTIGWN